MAKSFADGFKYVNENTAAPAAVSVSDAWIDEIQGKIDGLAPELVKLAEQKNLQNIDFLKGFIAEEWHNYTFNLDAQLHGDELTVLADRPDVNTFASPDITIGDKQFSLKYYNSGKASADAQAYTAWQKYLQEVKKGNDITLEEFCEDKNIDIDTVKMSMYNGMTKVIPSDMLEDAKEYLTRRVLKLENNLSPTAETEILAKRYREVLESLDDVIRDNDGNKSIQLTEKQAVALARAANGHDGEKIKNELLKECGLDLNAILNEQDLYHEALKAGVSAAKLSLIISLAPIIADVITQLIRDGEVDPDMLKQQGLNALTATARSFMSGAISSGIVLAARMGEFGEAYKDINAGAVATLVVVAVGTLDLALKLAYGIIDEPEFVRGTMRLYATSALAITAGSLLKIILPNFAFAYILGSFVGSIIGGFVYKGMERFFISLCIEDGCTFFGLVEQDYTLPDAVLDCVGVEQFGFDEFKIDRFNADSYQMDTFNIDEYHTDIQEPIIMRRNMIEFCKVAYITI